MENKIEHSFFVVVIVIVVLIVPPLSKIKKTILANPTRKESRSLVEDNAKSDQEANEHFFCLPNITFYTDLTCCPLCSALIFSACQKALIEQSW